MPVPNGPHASPHRERRQSRTSACTRATVTLLLQFPARAPASVRRGHCRTNLARSMSTRVRGQWATELHRSWLRVPPWGTTLRIRRRPCQHQRQLHAEQTGERRAIVLFARIPTEIWAFAGIAIRARFVNSDTSTAGNVGIVGLKFAMRKTARDVEGAGGIADRDDLPARCRRTDQGSDESTRPAQAGQARAGRRS